MLYIGNISPRFPRNSEAFASEFPENIEEVIPIFNYVDHEQLTVLRLSSTLCVISKKSAI